MPIQASREARKEVMDEIQETTTTMDPSLTGAADDRPARVKVYDRPARRTMPVWLLFLVVLIALALTWFAFQALR